MKKKKKKSKYLYFSIKPAKKLTRTVQVRIPAEFFFAANIGEKIGEAVAKVQEMFWNEGSEH